VTGLPNIGGKRRIRFSERLHDFTFYTGMRFPQWKRNVFVDGLREGGVPRTGHIERLVFNQRWEEVGREPMLTELKQRIRDVRQGPDGLIYVLTVEEDGALLRIEPRPAR
jgi:glucose/arabinose dehydrogenase